MSKSSSALDGYRRWLGVEVPARQLNAFRSCFALIWGCYDLGDLWVGGTHACMSIEDVLAGAASPIARLQCALLVCEVLMLTGRWPALVLLAAAALRGYLAFRYFELNDFLYYTMTALLLAVAYADATPLGGPARTVRRWTLDVIRWELGFMYVATGVLKMNPAWLSGGHLYAEAHYLQHAFSWPFPPLFLRCIDSQACASAEAWAAVILEITLGALVLWGRARRSCVLIACAIHGFAIVATNVWFFGFSMIAHIAFLGARPPAPAVKATDPGTAVADVLRH